MRSKRKSTNNVLSDIRINGVDYHFGYLCYYVTFAVPSENDIILLHE